VKKFLDLIWAVALVFGIVNMAHANIRIAAGRYHTVGLKSDGTVVAVGFEGSHFCDVGSWTDISQITAGEAHTVGLKSDGAVVAVGSNYYGQCEVSSWAFAPIFDQTGPQQTKEGEFLQLTITATDPDGDILIYSANNLPNGASFDPNTQTFSWTPSYTDGGNYIITFTVIDNGTPPLSDSVDVSITVENVVLPLPEIYSVTPNTGSNTVSTQIIIEGMNFQPSSLAALYDGGPYIAGSCDTNNAWDVYVKENYAYVADGPSGLQIIDISDPANSIVIGSCDTPDYAYGVDIKENYAYVADGSSGLQIIDISDPANPSIIGAYDTTGYAEGVYVKENYAYVADRSSGLQIIDISDPANPSIIGACDTTGYAEDVYVKENYAYVADRSSGLQIIDITDPANPIIIGSCDTRSAYGVYVKENYAYVADYDSGLQIIDISDPANPSIIGAYDTTGYAYSVYVKENYAYVAYRYSGLQIIDITDPANPTIIGSCDTNNAWDVYVKENYAYVADRDSGLQIIDITDPANPIIIGMDTPDAALGINVKENYAYVADGISGLQIIDITDPANPSIIGSYDTGYANDVYVKENYAYVADNASGLQIIDISDSANPTIIGFCDTPDYALGVYVKENYAYVAYRYSGLQIIDITEPANPSIIGACYTPGIPLDVYVKENYAYVADGISGLQIIDITDPANPIIIGACDTPDYACDVYVKENYAYVADYESGLQIIDISDPANSIVIGSCDTPDYAYGVDIKENYAYVADNDSGLQIIDISDPANPSIIGAYDTPGYAKGVYVKENYAYVADYESGLQIIETFNPLEDINYIDSGTITASVPVGMRCGAYNLHVTNPDGGHVMLHNAFTICPNQSPQLENIGNKAINEGQLLKFTITATDPDGDGLNYSANYLPNGATFDPETQIFSWTPSFTDAGSYPITFIVIDDKGESDSEDITITIENVNQLPKFDQIENQEVNEGVLLEFTIEAIDPDGDELTYPASNLPTGASFDPDTQLFSWTPSFIQAGSYEIIFTVTDNGTPPLTDEETIAISVQNVNRPPELAPIGNRTVDKGKFLQFIITSIDPDGDELIYSANNLPDWANFDPNTQEFSWEPNYNQAGGYEVTFIVTDNGTPSLTDSETITIKVINKRRPSSYDNYHGYGWNTGWYNLTNYQQQVWNNQIFSNWRQPALQQWPNLSQTWQQQTWNQPFNLQSYTPSISQLQPWFQQQYQQLDFTGYLQQRGGLWNWAMNQSDFTGYQQQVFDLQKQQQLFNFQQKPWNQYNYLNIWQ